MPSVGAFLALWLSSLTGKLGRLQGLSLGPLWDGTPAAKEHKKARVLGPWVLAPRLPESREGVWLQETACFKGFQFWAAHGLMRS